jgi:glutamate 5-kinase
LVLAGAVGAAAYRGVNLAQLQVAQSDLDQGQVLAAFGQASLGSVLVMLIRAIGLVIGYALLAVGLWRTRAAPRGASGLIVAFLVVDIVGLVAGGNKGVLLVAHTLLLVGLGWIGVRILAMSDAQWRAEVGTQVRS